MFKKLIKAIFDHGFFVGTSLLVNIFLIQNVDQTEFGLYVFFYTFYIFVYGLHQAMIIEPYSVFSVGKLSDSATGYYQYFLSLQFRLFLVVLLFSFAVTILANIFFQKSFQETVFLNLIILFGSISLLWQFCRVRFYGQDNEIFSVMAGMLYFLSVFFSCLLLFLFDFISAINTFLVFLFSYTAPLILGIYINRRFLDSSEKKYVFKEEYWSMHFDYSKWIILIALIVPFYFNSYYWYLGYLSKFEVVAEIRSVLLITGIFQQFLVSVYLVILKDLSSILKKESLSILWRRSVKLYTLGFFALSIFYIPLILFGKEVIMLLYGPNYIQTATALKFGIIINGLQLAFFILNTALKTIYKPQAIFLAYLSGSLVTLTIGFNLVIKLGFMGAIYGLIFSEISMVLILIIFFARYRKQYANKNC